MADNSSKIDYIDTQGLSPKMSPEEAAKFKGEKRVNKPATVTPRRIITPELTKELKILINEVLDEREGKFNYTSYFDVDKYKHYVGEEEPEYKPWSKSKKSKTDYNPSYYQ